MLCRPPTPSRAPSTASCLSSRKPARYTGGEYNSVVKDWASTPYRLALIFPDVYDLGMSNLGMAILYDIVNAQPDMLAERAYTPWVDMLAAMRAAGIPLYGLETPPSAGRFRRARVQPALRTALHQRAHHARSGRHPAARRGSHGSYRWSSPAAPPASTPSRCTPSSTRSSSVKAKMRSSKSSAPGPTPAAPGLSRTEALASLARDRWRLRPCIPRGGLSRGWPVAA